MNKNIKYTASISCRNDELIELEYNKKDNEISLWTTTGKTNLDVFSLLALIRELQSFHEVLVNDHE